MYKCFFKMQLHSALYTLHSKKKFGKDFVIALPNKKIKL